VQRVKAQNTLGSAARSLKNAPSLGLRKYSRICSNDPRWRFRARHAAEYFFLRRYKDGAVLTLQKSSHYCASELKRCQEIGVEPYELTLNLLTLVCMCFMEMKREFAQSDTYSLPFFEQNSQNGWHNANAEKNLIQFPLDIKYSTEKN
jgi:hypothetical protein